MDPGKTLESMMTTLREKTGKDIQSLTLEIKNLQLKKHAEIRNYFKESYGLTYGYANTLTSKVREELEGKTGSNELVKNLFTNKPNMKLIYDKLLQKVNKFGEVEIAPKKTYVSLRVKKQFAILKPSTKSRFDIGLNLKGKPVTKRLTDGKKWNSMCTHRVSVSSVNDVDKELITWLKEAYNDST